MQSIDILRLRKEAIRLAKSDGFHQDAEDFAQEALEKLSQGRKTSVRNLFTDYLRANYGDNRDLGKPGTTAKKASIKSIEVKPKHLGSVSTQDAINHELDFESTLKYLTSEERSLVVLRHTWDLELKEIAHCFGVSESAISLRLKTIYKKLHAKINRNALRTTNNKQSPNHLVGRT